MKPKYIVAIDEGTSSVRAVLFDVLKKQIVSIKQEAITQHYPKPGWVEHNAEEIWAKAKQCLDAILMQAGAKNVAGIGITNQRETIVAWNKKTKNPTHNAIVWQCRRTADFCKKISTKDAKTIHQKTGLVADPYFSASKINWLLKNSKRTQAVLKSGNLCVGTIESFLAFNLTNGKSFVTDVSNASRTMLFNINTLKWDKWLLDYFGIDKSILPQVVANDEIVGFYEFGNVKIPIAGLIGDQQSSLFGQCCFAKGDIKNTYGTGSFLLLNTGLKPIFSKDLLTTIAWKLNGKTLYALEGSVFSCGTSVDWLKTINVIEKSNECDKLAESVNSCDGLVFVPAFTGLGAPYWSPNTKAMFYGITTSTTPAHFCRAVLESVAYSVKDIFDVFKKEGKIVKKTIKVDGGVSKSDFTMQYQSNLLQINIEKSKQTECTSLGAIFMCGLATKVWKNISELKKFYEPDKVFKPKISKQVAEQKILNYHNALYKALEDKRRTK